MARNDNGVPMYITILCKVVDNFGDIGVAWRLCRRLAKIQSKYKICLVVDDLEAFAKIEDGLSRSLSAKYPGIARNEATKQSIIIDGIEIFPWKYDALCHEIFSQNDGERLSLILELFQCGRPDWMERILFEEKLQRTVQIIMIDYLTAEKYAEDFHCLQSLTRSAKVQKVNFMPGFTEKTGGLVIDDAWINVPEWNNDGPVLVFTYENDWTNLAVALSDYCADSGRKVLVAQGRGKESFLQALKQVVALRQAQEPLHETTIIEELSYLNQSEWDEMMKGCSALVIRGEESMSRACLSGIPFIWHAYPQSDEYQLVKVRALLERMRPHFGEEEFEIVSNAWLEINGETWIASPSACNDEEHEPSSSLRGAQRRGNPYSDFFKSVPRLIPGFRDFALSLRKNGDLCANLMTYIEKLDII